MPVLGQHVPSYVVDAVEKILYVICTLSGVASIFVVIVVLTLCCSIAGLTF